MEPLAKRSSRSLAGSLPVQTLRYVHFFVLGGKRRLRYQVYTCGKIFSHASESGAYLIMIENPHFAKGSMFKNISTTTFVCDRICINL